MSQSRITGAILLRWDDCTSILSKHLTTLLQRPIQLCRMVEDYDYWCVASINTVMDSGPIGAPIMR